MSFETCRSANKLAVITGVIFSGQIVQLSSAPGWRRNADGGAENDAGGDAGDDTGAKKQVFPAAVLTDADAGATILYGIDNHIIILLFRKEK